MELDLSSSLARETHPGTIESVSINPMEPVKMEEGKETKVEGKLHEEDAEEGGRGPSEQLTSSRMGSVSAIESSQMFVSLLAEGSSIRYDSSMQVCVSSVTGRTTGKLSYGILLTDCFLCVLRWTVGTTLPQQALPVL